MLFNAQATGRLTMKANSLPILLILAGFALLGYVSYQLIGYLGLAILGLFSANILMNVDIQRGGAIGNVQAADVYARQMSYLYEATPTERAERRAEARQVALPKLVAKLISLGLIVVGFGMFFAVQLG
jgi:hypothetical protein